MVLRRELLEQLPGLLAVAAAAGRVGAADRGGQAPGGAAAASPRSLLDTYLATFASLRPREDVCCWYLGTMFLRIEGMPDIPVTQAETIMVYRARKLAPDAATMRWIEIGRFRDPLTGGPASTWLNPFSGQRVPMMKAFITEPGEYTIRAVGDRLSLRLVQPDAIVEDVALQTSIEGGRFSLRQVERKVRGASPGATPAEIARLPRSLTTLALSAAAGELADPARLNVRASGSYSFETAALPAWAKPQTRGSTIVRGIMQKAAMDEVVNAEAWQALRGLYPRFFAGDRVAPRW